MINHEKRIISVTEIGVFKRCRRMWDYMYRQRLTPVKEQAYFFVGRMTHQTLEEWTNDSSKSIEHLWAKTLAREIEFFETRYKETIGAQPSKDEVDDVIKDADMPLAMTVNYGNHWKSPLPEGFRLLQSEQTCLVQIPTLDNVWLEGTLDGFVLQELTNRLFVLERKTYENRPHIEVLESNEQFVGYVWILMQLFPMYDIGGVLYDGLWKRAVPPRGRTMDDLFFRHLILKSREEIARWEEQLIKVATDMTNPDVLIYPNRTWQGCFDDKSFVQLCTAESKDEDFDYIKENYYGLKSPHAWESYESDTI